MKLVLLFFLSVTAFAGVDTYNSGSGNWTAPAGGPWQVTIELWGAGGSGGGGEIGAGDGDRGAGGGGGGYVKHVVRGIAAGATIAYSVGTGATGTAVPDSCVDGTAGGDTTSTTYSLTAGGGGGGQSTCAAGGAGGSGGTATGGNTTNTAGTRGAHGQLYSSPETGFGGAGANGGAGGATDGANGTAPGGGGASCDESAPAEAGDGAAGKAQFTYVNPHGPMLGLFD